MRTPSTTNRRRIEISGIVQGVGFRPFVDRLATEKGLAGFVCNHPGGVTVEVEGQQEELFCFVNEISSRAPPLAEIVQVDVTSIQPVGEARFAILPSRHNAEGNTRVSPDVAICTDCLAEMNDPQDRRFQHPFINCTNCGPRFTITRELPYDRSNTTMAAFPMCESCRAEYSAQSNRRFHAEPICCPQCGPTLWFVNSDSLCIDPATSSAPNGCAINQDAIALFHLAVQAGKIVAVKGIGGFHLVCDATNPLAVDCLRKLKKRPWKPFAVMVRSTSAAKQIARVSSTEAELLNSQRNPIVLVERRPSNRVVCDAVAPYNNRLGLMLPYTPLHHLLLRCEVPLVMTSGNLSGQPIARTNEEAAERLAGIADAFLFHDREIHVACEDSVACEFRGDAYPLRRSRGYAPNTIVLPNSGPAILAVGGN